MLFIYLSEIRFLNIHIQVYLRIYYYNTAIKQHFGIAIIVGISGFIV